MQQVTTRKNCQGSENTPHINLGIGPTKKKKTTQLGSGGQRIEDGVNEEGTARSSSLLNPLLYAVFAQVF